MEKFLTKENIFIAAIVMWMIIQSNYFATKLDLSNVKLEMEQMKSSLYKYSDEKDEKLKQELDLKFNLIIDKIDNLRKTIK